jgi:hypothetical protein
MAIVFPLIVAVTILLALGEVVHVDARRNRFNAAS